jgi:hypothetical protein
MVTNILIGSSNVYRFYKPDLFKHFRVYNMINCTKASTFKASFSDNEEENIIISILENAIVDACGSDVDSRDEKAASVIKDVINCVADLADRKKTSKYVIVLPLMRPSIPWYQQKVDPIKDFITQEIVKKGRNNVKCVDCSASISQQFEHDGVHLTAAAGRIFIEKILLESEKFFNHASNGGEEEGATLEGTVSRIEKLEQDVANRFNADDLMFARIREELDTTSNRAKEDRIVLNGITCATPIPQAGRQRIDKLKVIAMDIFGKLKPGYACKIVFANPGRHNDQFLPMVELKMDKVEQAVELRKAFAEKRKANQLTGDLQRLFVTNSVNLATRVRIDILKALASRLTNDDDLAYVVGFIPRPMLHIKPKGDSSASRRTERSYTFVDAIKEHGSILREEDLGRAYSRAGRAFAGQLQQNFVVLKDEVAARAAHAFGQSARGSGRGGGAGAGARGGGSSREGRDKGYGGRGEKRSAADEGKTNSKNKKP